MPAPSAFPAWPFRAMGAPSKVVATEEGLPGILISTAETSPPEIPPIYRAINRANAVVESIPKVRGRQRAMAIVPVSPGIAPKTRPKAMPISI